MVQITPAKKKETPKPRRKTTQFETAISFDSQIPEGYKHRNTKWTVLNNACNTLLTGDHENVRIDVTKVTRGDIDRAVSSIRAAVYKWWDTTNVDKDAYRIRTTKGLTEDSQTYVVAWIEKVTE